MAVILASDVLTSCRTALLNDPTGAIYPDAAMYPVMNVAYRDLQNKLTALGVLTTKEVSAAVVVLAGVSFLGEGAGLPTDLLSPIKLKERRQGSTSVEDYIDMVEQTDEPQWKPIDMLLTWTWREDQIHFPPGGSTVNKEVLITYNKLMGSITGAASPIQIANVDVWLAHKTAVIACKTIGGNPTRAKLIGEELEEIWSDLRAIVVKRMQNRPVRRRRTRFRVA
jgi:hypothetical protein